MSEVEQRRKQLPSPAKRRMPGAGHGDDAARAARARRNAWVLGGLALAFYFGYMILVFVKGSSGG
jgi:hypothetical protein